MNANTNFKGFIKSLSSISPTTLNALRACALRATWSLSGNQPLLPISPRSRIGLIVHRLLAEAGKRQLQPDSDSINTRWVELVERAQQEMLASWIDRHLVPLERSVPEFEVRRLQAVQRALELAVANSAVSEREVGQEKPAYYGHELPVQSTDGLVRGVIDEVVPTETGPLIRDYKSGTIFETVQMDEYQLKEAYQVQLKIYASLYAEHYKVWPTRLEVVPLAGKAYEVFFDKADCTNLVVEARTTLGQINDVISANSSEVLPRLLANPSPQNCFYCQYRPVCEPYYSASDLSRFIEWPLDIRGTVYEVRQLGNSKIMLRVHTSSGLVNIPGLSPGERHPILPAIQANDIVGVFGLRRAGPNRPYAETSLTTIYKLPNTSCALASTWNKIQ